MKRKKGDYIELVKRLSNDIEDLVWRDKVNSQSVLDFILTEYKMDGSDDNNNSE